MKFPLAFVLIILAAMAQAQTGTPDHSDLIVLKFSCGAMKTGSGMIRSVQDPDPPKNEPIRINQTVANEPQEIKNRRDMAERRDDMLRAEVNAGLSRTPMSAIYFYRLRVKNASTKAVKSFAWEYQSMSEPNSSDRQFFCSIKAKANESKEIELFSPLAPSHLVDASKTKDKSAESPDAKVNINQIEYIDGTIWHRQGWNPKTFPDDAVHKVAPGRCIGL
jgi:hypothetical protein